MVKCPKCGAEIKYIPVGYTQSATGTFIVDPEYTEVINDNGRVIKGHIRHKCPIFKNLDRITDDECHALGY
jgi:phage FluMu protein Com